MADVIYKGIGEPTETYPYPQIKTEKSLIRDAVRSILLTKIGQRYMVPDFGSLLWTLIFEPNDSPTARLAETYIRTALGDWEPRVQVLEVTTQQVEESLIVTVNYVILRIQQIDQVQLDLSRDRMVALGG